MKIHEQYIKFWALLKANVIVLDDLMDSYGKVTDAKKKCRKLWKNLVKYLSYKKKWRFYYAWYHLFILNKKLKAAVIDTL